MSSVDGTTLEVFSGQTRLFPQGAESHLHPRLWRGSFNKRECSLHQLSPYVGKMKSGMARALIEHFTNKHDIVFDPFCGSGAVALEALLCGRRAWANDLSPYAFVLTRGKLEAPLSIDTALSCAGDLIGIVSEQAAHVDLDEVPTWVAQFFHPQTLRETVVAFRTARDRQDYFLLACLLGILHHVRPGFLSYPASHLVPYLRASKYPREKHPRMYDYRDLKSRLIAKVRRALRMIPKNWTRLEHRVWQVNAMDLPIQDSIVDAIISSPPYFGALDYARDNRLRLWFLGSHNWRDLDKALTANNAVYLPQMRICLTEMNRVLKPRCPCVLVLGDVEKDGKTRRTAEILGELAESATGGELHVETIIDDYIPDDRRSRRRTRTTKYDRILIMRKR